jgi:peptide/nickel transport system substrate-binding protein
VPQTASVPALSRSFRSRQWPLVAALLSLAFSIPTTALAGAESVLPRTIESNLENGVRLIVVPAPAESQLAHVHLATRAGAALERDAGSAGAAAALAAALASHPDVAALVARGAEVVPEVAIGHVGIGMSCALGDLERAMRALVAALAAADAADIDASRYAGEVVSNEPQQTPAFDLALALAFERRGELRAVRGRGKPTKEAVQGFAARHLRPESTSLAVTGVPGDPGATFVRVRDVLTAWARRPAAALEREVEPALRGPRRGRVEGDPEAEWIGFRLADRDQRGAAQSAALLRRAAKELGATLVIREGVGGAGFAAIHRPRGESEPASFERAVLAKLASFAAAPAHDAAALAAASEAFALRVAEELYATPRGLPRRLAIDDVEFGDSRLLEREAFALAESTGEELALAAATLREDAAVIVSVVKPAAPAATPPAAAAADPVTVMTRDEGGYAAVAIDFGSRFAAGDPAALAARLEAIAKELRGDGLSAVEVVGEPGGDQRVALELRGLAPRVLAALAALPARIAAEPAIPRLETRDVLDRRTALAIALRDGPDVGLEPRGIGVVGALGRDAVLEALAPWREDGGPLAPVPAAATSETSGASGSSPPAGDAAAVADAAGAARIVSEQRVERGAVAIAHRIADPAAAEWLRWLAGDREALAPLATRGGAFAAAAQLPGLVLDVLPVAGGHALVLAADDPGAGEAARERVIAGLEALFDALAGIEIERDDYVAAFRQRGREAASETSTSIGTARRAARRDVPHGVVPRASAVQEALRATLRSPPRTVILTPAAPPARESTRLLEPAPPALLAARSTTGPAFARLRSARASSDIVTMSFHGHASSVLLARALLAWARCSAHFFNGLLELADVASKSPSEMGMAELEAAFGPNLLIADEVGYGPPEGAGEIEVLRRWFGAAVPSLNTWTHPNANTSDALSLYVMLPLAMRHLDALDRFGPGAADYASWSANRKEIVVRLRRDLRWQFPAVDRDDPRYAWLAALFAAGAPSVTADDVAFTHAVVTHPDLRSQAFGNAVAGTAIEVLDRFTYKMTFEEPTIHAFVLALGFDQILPRWLYGRDESGAEIPAEALGKGVNEHWHNQKLCGYGPYHFVRMDPDREIVLERDPAFPVFTPAIGEIHWRILTNPDQVLLQLRSGELDHVTLSPQQYRQDYLEAKEGSGLRDPRFTLKPYRQSAYIYIGYNTRRPPFDDPRVRRAMGHAVNRESVLKVGFLGLGRLVDTHFMPEHPLRDPDLEPLRFDTDLASRLLDEAGWEDRDGNGVREKRIEGKLVELKFKLSSFADSAELAVLHAVFKQDLLAIGVECDVLPLPERNAMEAIRTREFDAYVGLWGTAADVDLRQQFHSRNADAGGNYPGIVDSELDALTDGYITEFDYEKRRAIAHRLQARIHELAPYTFLFQRDRMTACASWLDGLHYGTVRPQLVSFGWHRRKDG